MFGWKLIREREINFEYGLRFLAEAELELCERENEHLQEEYDRILVENEEIKEENKRLFDLHNKKLTKPKRGKGGRYRGRDGKFVKAPK